jgi:general secretion pathway protein G
MFKNILKSKNSGFSILEIVVVIIVIAFFAMLIIPGLISGPARARDATRKSDLRLIKSALENYYNNNNSYPATLADLEKGVPPFIKKLPKDPKTGKDYVYITTGNPPGTFVLQATLENKNDKDLKTNNNDPNTGLYIIQGTNN